jgi:23S rRNA (uracil1939-C5)-methyltransferase
MNLNEILNVKITDLAMGGEGVAHVGGMAIFVPDSVPGDELKVRVFEAKRSYAKARIIEILRPSNDRVEPKCPLSKICGGCQWQQIDYSAQLRFKTNIVKETLERIGKLPNVKVNDTIGMQEPWGFRNKIQYPISGYRGQGQGVRTIMGYYKQGTHDVVDIDTCPIEHPKLSRAAKIVKDVLNKFRYSTYNEDKAQGLFRYLRARIGFGTGEVLLTFITNEKGIPSARELIKETVNRCKKDDINVVGICQNLNPRQTNVIMGEKSWSIWGRDFIYDTMGGLKFKVSNSSFYQTNPIQTQVLYNKALEFAQVTNKDTVIDAYSGIGTVALWFAKHAAYVYGIEEVKEAVHDAAENAELNKIENCRFSIGKVEKLLPELDAGDILVLDPPRGGCEEKVLKTIGRSELKKVIYISCNPSTLARDLEYLSKTGFVVDQVQPVDMFPHSFHIETVTKLVRKS